MMPRSALGVAGGCGQLLLLGLAFRHRPVLAAFGAGLMYGAVAPMVIEVLRG